MARSPALEPPPGNPRFPLADSIRALAVLGVIACHTSGFSGADGTASWGWIPFYAGIDGLIVFFVLSGFLLYRPYASAHAGLRPAPSLRSFARRRALRILPAYWVALTLLAIWPGVPGPFSSKWWVYYGFLQVYSSKTITHGIPVAWSLCVEVSFYLVLPLVAAVAARFARRARSVVAAEAIVLCAFGAIGLGGRLLTQAGVLPLWAGNTLVSATLWFALGMALAVGSVAFERRGSTPRVVDATLGRSWLAWGLAACALTLAAHPFDIFGLGQHPRRAAGLDVLASNRVLLGVAAALFVAPVVFGRGGAIRRLLANRWLAFVGLVSYAMYLWHWSLAAWLADAHAPQLNVRGGPGIQRIVGGQATLTLFLATTALTLAVATASYYLVELPFLRYKERRFGLRRRAPAGEVAQPRVGVSVE